MSFTSYLSSDELNHELCEKIAQSLTQAIAQRGKASLLVSGGRTPIPLFEMLSQVDIDWHQVVISLVDDRWVDVTSNDSNEHLVKTHLLINKARNAQYVGLVDTTTTIESAVANANQSISRIPTPFDFVILGMGEDGHTASLFPCCEELAEGFDLSNGKTYLATHPQHAPYARISLTLAALISSRHVVLHLVGDAKRQVYEAALHENDETNMPIKAVLSRTNVDVMWAP